MIYGHDAALRAAYTYKFIYIIYILDFYFMDIIIQLFGFWANLIGYFPKLHAPQLKEIEQ